MRYLRSPLSPISLLRDHFPVAVLLLVLVGFGLAGPVEAVTVTIQPSNADTMLDEIAPTTNSGSATTMSVRSQNGNRDRRIIVEFDLSQIPAGATINSATFQLFMTSAPSANRTYNAHRITRDWIETQATWNQAQTGTNWTTAGGDYNGAVTGSTTTGTTSNVWRSWTITADVQAWVNGSAQNYGTLIKDNSENSGTARTATFATRENGTTGNRPRLVVDYQPAYTITLPPGSGVVMSEPSLLNFTIANINQSPATETLGRIYLTFPYAVASAVPPPGWKVTDITGNNVLFDTEDAYDPGCSAAALANGESAVFGVYLTATAQASETTTDTISAATVGNDCDTPGAFQYYFTRSGSFPTWARRGLGATMLATPTNVGVGDTITLSMMVTNRATGTQNIIAPVTNPTVSGTGSVTKLTGPTPASANLASGASQTFTWTYQATGAGTVTFTATASNASVQTLSTSSNSVLVGNLTASLSVSPEQQTSGGQVTVTMSVTNNGTTTLTNIAPSALTTSGSATVNLVSGPTPASYASLSPDASTSFSWTYTVSGSTGATFSFTGNASADGGITSNSAASNTGSISSIGVSVSPSSIPTTSAATLTYTVDNQSGHAIRRVVITAPNTSFVYGSATGPSGWTVTTAGSPVAVTFNAPTPGGCPPTCPNDLASGNSANFAITWSAVPSTVNTFAFTVDMTTRDGLNYTRSASVTTSQYLLLISASPTTILGNGISTSTISVTLTNGGSPINGATITLTKTMGTLAQPTLVTNSSGQASTTLTSAATATDQTATVTATYGVSTTAQVNVAFQGITLTLAPATATVDADGQSTVALTLTFRYTTGGGAISGATATISKSGIGSVSPASAASSASPIAVTYTAGTSSSDTSATVTATYGGLSTASTITLRGITLTLTPSSATVDADGQSTVALTLTFRYANGGGAISGATATLSATAGGVAPTSAASSASTIAVTYTAPALSSDSSANVTATYRGLSAASAITLRGITFTLTPSSATVEGDGQSTVALTLTFRYANGGGAISGATATVSATSGSVSPTSPASSSSAIAVTYTAPVVSSDGSATVTAAYKGFTPTTTITLRAVTVTIGAAPASIAADGVTTSSITATLTAGGSPLSGKSVNFSTTAGSLSDGSATTNGSGQATVALTSVASKSNVSATVTATYASLTPAQTSVTFTGITIPEVGYLTGRAGNGTIELNWANPGQYFTGVLIIRKSGSAPTGGPSDGTSYSVGNPVGDATVVFTGVATTLSQSGLANGTDYHYKAYVRYAATSLYSGGTSLDLAPSPGGPGQAEWSFGVAGGSLLNGPTVDYSGNLYQSAGTDRLVGVTQADASQLWAPVGVQGNVLGGVTWAPVSGSGYSTNYLIVGDQTGQLYAMDAASGSSVWAPMALPGAEAIEAAPAVQLGDYSDAAFQAQYGATTDVIFVASKNSSTTTNRVYAVRLSDGALLWQFNATGAYQMDGSVGGIWIDYSRNQLYIPTRAGAAGTQPSLWVLDSLTGNLLGNLSLGHIDSAPTQSYYDDSTLYVATTSGNLEAIDVSGPSPVRKWSGPVVLGSAITSYVWEDYTVAGLLYFATQDGQVWALQDPGAGAPPNPASPVWKRAVAGASAPLVLDTSLFVGSSDGRLYELSLTDGAILKQQTIGNGSAAVGSPGLSDSTTLYVGTSTGKLFRYSLPLP